MDSACAHVQTSIIRFMTKIISSYLLAFILNEDERRYLIKIISISTKLKVITFNVTTDDYFECNTPCNRTSPRFIEKVFLILFPELFFFYHLTRILNICTF